MPLRTSNMSFVRLAVSLWVLFAWHAFSVALAADVPDVAYQARSQPPMPPTSVEQPRIRLEEFAALPSPANLRKPVPRSPVTVAEPPRDIWERIRRQFAMPLLKSPLVDRQVNWYLSRPEILKGILQRSRRYLYHVVSELERRNLPAELALLPMVESGYSPHALSSAQASGLWQFIPETGKRYQLAQTNKYDGRRDVVASTRAALDYLQFLFDMFGDWHLALASYNWGENAVAAAVERNRSRGRPTTYDTISMPEETRLYVPKLQALKTIIANPESFGIDLGAIPNEPYFAEVENSRNLDLKLAAKLAEMPLDEFLALNPAFNGNAISAGDRSMILLPVNKVDAFKTNLQSVRPAPTARPPQSTARGNGPGTLTNGPKP
jgi:membrane-bound lytic murein transglycosylase D